MNVPSRSAYALAFETCIDILRLRKGPEDMPASAALLRAVIVGAVLMRVAAHAMVGAESSGNPAVLIALELGLLLLGVKLALRAAGHQERFTQTATSILGCQLVMAPALLASRWLLLTYFDQPGMGSVARLLFVAVALWLLVVTVRILRSATGWPVFATVVLALGIEVVTMLVALMLYPPAVDPLAPVP